MSFLIIFQNILFSYSHHDKYEFYLYSILLYNKKQENYYIGGIADYVDKKANLILTTCSMAWGTSYIFMKLGIEGLSPLMLMALRTGIAFLILVLIFSKVTES